MIDLNKIMLQKILILDGAMGTMLQQANLTSQDFGGDEYDGCNELLNVTRPDLITQIHEAYYKAGADIVETNTFGATSIVLAEYDIADRAYELNIAAAECAIKARDKLSTPDWPRFVAGAMGPTTKTLSVTGGATFEEMIESYYEQAHALIKGGVDILLLETSQDTLNVKAGGIGINKAFDELGKKLPIIISGTIEPMGTMLAGQSIEAFYLSIQHLNPLAVGLNCATGPEFMQDHMRTLSSTASCATSCYPNAGLPDENGDYLELPKTLAAKLAEFANAGWLNLVGGCCGTTPDHIRAIAEAFKDKKPRTINRVTHTAISGIEAVHLSADNRPLLVGERTNVIGSRLFKNLIAAGKYEEAAEIARKQVKRGAHVIDICLADPDRDELQDMKGFLYYITRQIKAPLMIDSTDVNVIAESLKYIQGKAVINSINLEDGEERFVEVIPLIHKFGAAVVVGLIDEEGMAVSRERKLEIALRSHDLLVNKYGISEHDIIFDPLVFPVGTGDIQYLGSALETVEGLRQIKARLPNCSTILGVSNVSFGLPLAGREVLNAVYMYQCTKAGLDYAIVNTEKLERYASIPEKELRLAEELLFKQNLTNHEELLADFTAYFRVKKKEDKVPLSTLTLEERLARYIIEGYKDGLVPDLEAALKKYKPLDIINGPLMAGMDEVGRLFNDNQLIVAEVLQSAEVMKASVSFLEPHMDKSDVQAKGKILLATVKGDVHDIGKNLVEIILANNGFEIVNLGIKVPPEQIIAAVRTENPDAIGLSGLLVKSAQQMILTAQDMKLAKISTPILVGGAALSRKFTDNRIAPEYEGLVLYAKDAMNGLELANKLVNKEERAVLNQEYKDRQILKETANQDQKIISEDQPIQKSNIKLTSVANPRDYKKHIYKNYPLDHLISYMNLQMLLGKHLGAKGNIKKLLAENDPKTTQLKQQIDDLLAQSLQNNWLQCHGMYQFFSAQSNENKILIYDEHDSVLECFDFPRQQKAPYLCLADFIHPVESGIKDVVGFLAVTAGTGVRERSEFWKSQGEYFLSYALQAIAIETAESFAERLHEMMRDAWGFADSLELTMADRHAAKYRGMRVSFGYPACPNLEDQNKLFRLLKPQEIGIELTEGFMMEPEASVSAMVFAHPAARYFSV